MESRTVTEQVEVSTTQVEIQGEWFDYDLIESLLDSDGFFDGVLWHGPMTWVPESFPEGVSEHDKYDHPDYKAGYYIIEGQMGELQKRGLARKSNRGWYGTDTLKRLVEGQGGLP